MIIILILQYVYGILTNDDNAPSFKYKVNPIGNIVADGRNKKKKV